jgi:hypothetical protein
MNPTQIELAILAATVNISEVCSDEFSGCDESEIRAHIAFGLWEACGELLATRPAMGEVRRSKAEEVRLFMSNFESNERVPLEKFLKAVMPRSKPETRMTKWMDYRESSIRAGNWWEEKSMNEQEASQAVAAAHRHDNEQGIDFKFAWATRTRFLAFNQDESRKMKTNKAESSKSAKELYGFAREVLAAKKMTPELNARLSTLKVEDLSTIRRLNMDPKDILKWDAAVKDAKAPTSARPRQRVNQK